MIATRLVPVFLCIGLSAALVLRNPDHNHNEGSTVCGGELFASSGTIRSPGYPRSYPNNVHCEWIVHAEPGKNTRFLFWSMNLESRAGCSSDYVEIKEVRGDKDVVLGRYCGSAVPEIITSNATVKIIFQSDATVSLDGFELRYATAEGGQECGGIFVDDHGTINSPNVTVSQSNECEWFVISQPGKGTRFEIEILSKNENPDCEHDFYAFKMHVHDPHQNPAYIPMHIHACNHEKSWVLTSPGPVTTISFKPDSVHTLAGFRLSYSTVKK